MLSTDKQTNKQTKQTDRQTNATKNITSFAKEVKSYERIGMKFYGRILSSTRKNWLNFGGDLGIVRWVIEQKNTVIVVAYPDRGAGNDTELFFFFFFFFQGGGYSLSQPRLNIFTVGNMRVMICLGQGGLHSLSASSF